MISEITFSKRFTSFWNEVLPNSKNYVRLINGGLIDAVYEPFEAAERKNNTALVNVLSFAMLRLLCDGESSLDVLCSNRFFKGNKFRVVLDESLAYLSRFNYGQGCELPLTNQEVVQVGRLFKAMYSRCVAGKSHIKIDPAFDGCGYINQSFGDLISDGRLIEIKSGERQFSVTDIRQVVVYLVLNHYSKAPINIRHVELFNPRKGIAFSEEVEGFCRNISALSSQELYSEVQKFVVDNNFVEEYGV
ncbi:hypothetical protein [Azotobacter vinelandii]